MSIGRSARCSRAWQSRSRSRIRRSTTPSGAVDRDGSASAFVAPPSWPETLTLRWKAGVGDGYGTPLVVGRVVYAFTRRDANEVLTALDADTGRGLWRDLGTRHRVLELAHRRGAVTRAAVRRHRGDHGNPRPHVSDRHTDRARSTARIRRGTACVIHELDTAAMSPADVEHHSDAAAKIAFRRLVPFLAPRIHRCLDRSGERRICGAADEPSTGLHGSRVRVRRRRVLHRLRAVRGAEQSAALSRRRAALVRPHHDHVGAAWQRDGARARRDVVLRAAFPARRRGSRLLSGRDLLSRQLVSQLATRTRRGGIHDGEPVVVGDWRSSGGPPAHAGFEDGAGRLAMAVSDRGHPRRRARRGRPCLPARYTRRRALALAEAACRAERTRAARGRRRKDPRSDARWRAAPPGRVAAGDHLLSWLGRFVRLDALAAGNTERLVGL